MCLSSVFVGLYVFKIIHVGVCLSQEDMKKLRVQLEEAIKENEKLRDEITKTGAVRQKDW